MACGNQRTGTVCCLDHHYTERQAADDPVTGRKPETVRLGAKRIFTNHCPCRGYMLIQIVVARRVYNIKAASQHRNCLPFSSQCTLMGGTINAQGQTAYDAETLPG